jgi:hypothetical protein
VGEVEMKERILLTRMKYSVLKKKNEGDRCGWSKLRPACRCSSQYTAPVRLTGGTGHDTAAPSLYVRRNRTGGARGHLY